MLLAALVACAPPPPAAAAGFSDAARYALGHFDDPEPTALAAPLLALEDEIVSTLDLSSATSADRALSPEALTDDDIAGLEHPDRDPARMLPVAVARLSAFPVPDHVGIALRTDLAPMEPSSPHQYDRTFLDGEECWADDGCDFLHTTNRITKENALMTVAYGLDKDYRWVDLDDGRVAIAARSWMPASATGEDGGTTLWQSYTVEMWVPQDDGRVLRMMAVWSETELSTPVDDDLVISTVRVGIDELFEAHDDWLAEQ
jgi:hypothetical protein